MLSMKAALLNKAIEYYESGKFLSDLKRRVAIPTESQVAESASYLEQYLQEEIGVQLKTMGFEFQLIQNPIENKPPLLIASRIEKADYPTVLMYGHGDVVNGQDTLWDNQRSPWGLSVEGDKIYGRGAADNKGQHTINLTALQLALYARNGHLHYNIKIIFEMGEELGSPGLEEVCALYKDKLKADVFIASDGPRVKADNPTLFLGSRGCIQFRLSCKSPNKPQHAGNWGGILMNPATVLVNALSSLIDAHGVIQVEGLRPPVLSSNLKALLQKIHIDQTPTDPQAQSDWGEPGLSASEKLFGWNTLEVIALEAGNNARPVGAVPAKAEAVLQLRFVVGTDYEHLEAHIQKHLHDYGIDGIQMEIHNTVPATRLNPNDPWVVFVQQSIKDTLGKEADILPNLGGTIPNHCFAEVLGLPTIWLPHSYRSCAQHAPNEHLLGSVAKEGLQLMTGLFWDLSDYVTTLKR